MKTQLKGNTFILNNIFIAPKTHISDPFFVVLKRKLHQLMMLYYLNPSDLTCLAETCGLYIGMPCKKQENKTNPTFISNST